MDISMDIHTHGKPVTWTLSQRQPALSDNNPIRVRCIILVGPLTDVDLGHCLQPE